MILQLIRDQRAIRPSSSAAMAPQLFPGSCAAPTFCLPADFHTAHTASVNPRQFLFDTMEIPRPGRPEDLDGVTEVIIQAMPDDPQWNYRFPKRREFPDDHRKYTKMLLQCFLDPAFDDWAVMVVEDRQEDQDARIVSFGVFDVSYKNKRKMGTGYQTQDRKCHALSLK